MLSISSSQQWLRLYLNTEKKLLRRNKEIEGNSEDETLNEEQKERSSDSKTNSANENKPFDINIENPVIDFKMMLYLTTTKFGIKSMEIIKNLPKQIFPILKTFVIIFDEKNSSKNFKASDLYTANLKTLNKIWMPKDSFSDFN